MQARLAGTLTASPDEMSRRCCYACEQRWYSSCLAAYGGWARRNYADPSWSQACRQEGWGDSLQQRSTLHSVLCGANLSLSFPPGWGRPDLLIWDHLYIRSFVEGPRAGEGLIWEPPDLNTLWLFTPWHCYGPEVTSDREAILTEFTGGAPALRRGIYQDVGEPIYPTFSAAGMHAGKSLLIMGNVGYQSTCGILLCRREEVLSAPRVRFVLKA